MVHATIPSAAHSQPSSSKSAFPSQSSSLPAPSQISFFGVIAPWHSVHRPSTHAWVPSLHSPTLFKPQVRGACVGRQPQFSLATPLQFESSPARSQRSEIAGPTAPRHLPQKPSLSHFASPKRHGEMGVPPGNEIVIPFWSWEHGLTAPGEHSAGPGACSLPVAKLWLAVIGSMVSNALPVGVPASSGSCGGTRHDDASRATMAAADRADKPCSSNLRPRHSGMCSGAWVWFELELWILAIMLVTVF